MADINAQLEANGLPTQFESTSNAPEVSHAVENTAATLANSEISQLKQQAPDIDVSTISKPVQPTAEPILPSAQPVTSENDVSLQDDKGVPVNGSPGETKVNGHATVNAPEPVLEPTPVSSQQEPANVQPVDSSFTDSGLPDAIASTNQSVELVSDVSVNAEMVTDPAPHPEQAPVSDLRSAPHADHLSPEAVANVEAAKHEMDNNADIQTSAPAPAPVQAVTPTPIDTQAAITDKETSLPTPQSPPPPPEPAPTELPAQPQPPPVPEVVPVIPSIEDVDVTIPDEKPADPAPTPAAPTIEPQDEEMIDAPAPTSKIAREREDDAVDEPVAKRLKTDEEKPEPQTTSFKIPDSSAPAPAASKPVSTGPIDADDAVTPARLSHMKKVISNLKKSNASTAFRLPVDPIALKIPTYRDIVTKPMDLGTIDNHLKHNEYQSIQAFKDDFYQIIKNCVLFNGADHGVTQQGRKMESSFNNQMSNLPPPSIAEPAKVDKKVTKPKVEPVRPPQPRRQSVTGKASSPKAPSPATFAPDPSGMPLIRRDSAMDGRPKRAIIPSKRNSDFGGARPKKKKYELELRFCDEVLKTIGAPKYWQANQYFTHPVDPVALNIPTYFQIIKKPMDLGTVRQKLDGGMYEKAKEFEEDVRLIFKNCYKFNQEGDYVYQRGQELEKLFNVEWAKKQDWISAREPDSEPASVGGDDDDEESEDEVEVESEEEDQSDQLKALQAQLDAIKNQMGQLSQQKKKKSSPGAGPKKGDKKKAKKEQSTTKFPGLAQKESGKKAKPAKKKAEKDRYVTFAEKQYISNGIAMLPERPMSEALKIIQNSVPALANSDQGEIELDIEEVPNHALLKLLAFVKKYAGPPPEEEKPEYSAPAVSKSKKSKSMSKADQDAQIAELKGTLHHYEAGSPDALQSIETGAEDSEDDDSNEESEEE